MDRIGPFEKLTEYRGEDLPNGVYVALQSHPINAQTDRVWEVRGPSTWLLHLARFYLCVTYPRNGELTNAQQMEEGYRQMKYNGAVEVIATITIQSALGLLPIAATGAPLESRIEGEYASFRTFGESEVISLLEIARGGSWITQLAQKKILPAWVRVGGRIYAEAQRDSDSGGEKLAHLTIKGRRDLRNTNLMVLEQALATGRYSRRGCDSNLRALQESAETLDHLRLQRLHERNQKG